VPLIRKPSPNPEVVQRAVEPDVTGQERDRLAPCIAGILRTGRKLAGDTNESCLPPGSGLATVLKVNAEQQARKRTMEVFLMVYFLCRFAAGSQMEGMLFLDVGLGSVWQGRYFRT